VQDETSAVKRLSQSSNRGARAGAIHTRDGCICELKHLQLSAGPRYNTAMVFHIDAIYENGILRPLAPLGLAENERVKVAVHSADDDDWLDRDFLEFAQREADPSITLEQVRAGLAKISGSFSDAVIAERGEY